MKSYLLLLYICSNASVLKCKFGKRYLFKVVMWLFVDKLGIIGPSTNMPFVLYIDLLRRSASWSFQIYRNRISRIDSNIKILFIVLSLPKNVIQMPNSLFCALKVFVFNLHYKKTQQNWLSEASLFNSREKLTLHFQSCHGKGK